MDRKRIIKIEVADVYIDAVISSPTKSRRILFTYEVDLEGESDVDRVRYPKRSKYFIIDGLDARIISNERKELV